MYRDVAHLHCSGLKNSVAGRKYIIISSNQTTIIYRQVSKLPTTKCNNKIIKCLHCICYLLI